MKLAVYLGFTLLALSFATETIKEDISDITTDEVEKRLIQEWNFCSRFCRRACRWRFYDEEEKIRLCIEYACGCQKEEPSNPDEPE